MTASNSHSCEARFLTFQDQRNSATRKILSYAFRGEHLKSDVRSGWTMKEKLGEGKELMSDKQFNTPVSMYLTLIGTDIFNHCD